MFAFRLAGDESRNEEYEVCSREDLKPYREFAGGYRCPLLVHIVRKAYLIFQLLMVYRPFIC
jgi:hypothetical protein